MVWNKERMERFQAVRNLVVDGKMGPRTREEMRVERWERDVEWEVYRRRRLQWGYDPRGGV